MTEDRVLARIGEHARQEQKDDARFERVARGEADGDEVAALERAASADPELATRLEASRPLESGVSDRIATRLTAKATPKRDRTTETGAEESKKVVPLRPAWMRRVVVAAGPLAIAAAMIIYVVGQRGPSGPELPAYSVTATGEQAMRGTAEASARLRLAKKTDGEKGRDARFELTLRPATAARSKVVAYAFTFGESGADATPLEARVEIAPEGAVRLTGPSRSLDGAREIRIVVGAPAAIGKFDDASARAKNGTTDSQVRVLVVPIDRE